ncbi:Endospore coat-associated protein YheD [compost metagenome]
MGQDYVGILLNSGMYRGIPQRKTGQESLANYEEAAGRLRLTPCFFRLGDIDLRLGTTVVYILNGRDYIKTIIPTPAVIHNRALYPEASAHRKIQKLALHGIKVFNVNNRYGKDYIHGILWSDPALHPYLPHTVSASATALKKMQLQYDDLILKPVRGSVGQGIMRLQRTRQHWKLTYTSASSKKSGSATRLKYGELPVWVRRQWLRVPYLIQERIPLAEYNNRPIDLRITVQRGIDGMWQVTGCFAKAAPQGSFISNLGKGGDAFPAELVLSKALPGLSIPAVISNVEKLALSCASLLSDQLPLMADLGLDIGLNTAGHPYFIECNGRDQRYGFRKAKMYEVWQETYRQPMAFAKYLLNHSAALPIPASNSLSCDYRMVQLR